jgi:hypothetical protein
MIRATIIAAATLAGLSGASGQYCANYSDGTQNCGIPTLESCQQSVSGVGGECGPDNSAAIPRNLMQRLFQPQPQTPPSIQDPDPMPPPPQQ